MCPEGPDNFHNKAFQTILIPQRSGGMLCSATQRQDYERDHLLSLKSEGYSQSSLLDFFFPLESSLNKTYMKILR